MVKEVDWRRDQAVKRMEMLELDSHVITDFKETGIVMCSCPQGCIVNIVPESYSEFVNEFEKETGYLVYHIVYTVTMFSETISYLYVSDLLEDWGMDLFDIMHGRIHTYIEDLNFPEASQFATVKLCNDQGCLQRVS